MAHIIKSKIKTLRRKLSRTGNIIVSNFRRNSRSNSGLHRRKKRNISTLEKKNILKQLKNQQESILQQRFSHSCKNLTLELPNRSKTECIRIVKRIFLNEPKTRSVKEYFEAALSELKNQRASIVYELTINGPRSELDQRFFQALESELKKIGCAGFKICMILPRRDGDASQ